MLWRFWTLSRTAYWALFDPGTPVTYLANVVVRPTFNVLVFGYLVSTVAEGAAVRTVVIGAAILTLNWSTVGATLQTVGYELGNGTLGITVASPVSRARLLASRGILHIPNGLVTAASAGLIGTLVFDLEFSGATWWGIAGSVLLIATSFTAMGLLAGVGSLALREVWALLGVLGILIYLFSGAIVPLDSLHPAAEGFASVVPGRWGVEALHHSLSGDGFDDIAPYWAAEIVVGAAFFLAAVLALRLYEANARRRGSVDLV
jgi:ABC-type multidrug transport system permease subunit